MQGMLAFCSPQNIPAVFSLSELQENSFTNMLQQHSTNGSP